MSSSCIFCHESSIERRVLLSKKKHLFFEGSRTGLTCSSCSRFSCSDCLADILRRIPKSWHKKNLWCQTVGQFLINGKHQAFLGSCCELQEIKDTSFKMLGKSTLSYDGCLFFPEYRLLIDSPIGNGGPIDIHGLAKHKTSFLGVVHCVLSKATCTLASNSNIQANGKGAQLKNYTTTELLRVEIKMCYASVKQFVSSTYMTPGIYRKRNSILTFPQLNVEIFLVKKVLTFDKNIKGNQFT